MDRIVFLLHNICVMKGGGNVFVFENVTRFRTTCLFSSTDVLMFYV